ncbi:MULTISPECIES: hypothetical protein [Sphingobacterium]|uniref:hypothetical protein n=1 Tax=Sphingobacterium TaxID=28453 RepID=UPI0013DB8DE7|nr:MULTISPECIES: hypothetical protein [unclassified Sphingobacterium]
MMELQEIKELLPTKWSDITLEKYIELFEILPDDEDVNIITKTVDAYLWVFIGKSLIDLKLSTTDVINIVNQIFSIDKDVESINETELKNINELDYETFITLIKLQEMNSYKVFNQMIQLMLKDSTYTADDINKWSMAKVQGFFLSLEKQLIEYLQHSVYCLKMKKQNTQVNQY